MGDGSFLSTSDTWFTGGTVPRRVDSPPCVGGGDETHEKTTYDLVICTSTQAELQTKIERLFPKGVEPWMALVGTPSQLVDIVGGYERVGADHLCMDFAGNDPESYALFVEAVIGKWKVNK